MTFIFRQDEISMHLYKRYLGDRPSLKRRASAAAGQGGLPSLRRPSPELSEKSLRPLSSRAAAFCSRFDGLEGLCGDAVTIKDAETLP